MTHRIIYNLEKSLQIPTINCIITMASRLQALEYYKILKKKFNIRIIAIRSGKINKIVISRMINMELNKEFNHKETRWLAEMKFLKEYKVLLFHLESVQSTPNQKAFPKINHSIKIQYLVQLEPI